MEILVCAKRVPDTSENEIELDRAGTDIERDELVYSINEPDNYAVEEALQLVDRTGGTVTVTTVGSRRRRRDPAPRDGHGRSPCRAPLG